MQAKLPTLLPRSIRPEADTSRNRSFDVYDAATRRNLGQLIRTLPASTQSRFRMALEGIVLPVKEKHRLRFLRELAGLSARLLEPGRTDAERATGLMARRGYGEGMIRPEVESIEKTFALIRNIAAVSMKSSKPSDYLRLLSRPGVDIQRFMSTMCFFAKDRKIEIKTLDMGLRKIALDMVRSARRSTSAPLRSLLSHIVARIPQTLHGTEPYESDWRILHAFDIAAGMVRDSGALSRLLRNDHAGLIRDHDFFQLDEMQERIAKARKDPVLLKATHRFLISCGIYLLGPGRTLRFGKMFKEGPIEGYVVLKPERLRSYGYEGMTTADIDDPTALLASERERSIQHELQHVFDKIIYVESALRAEDGTGETRRNLLGMEYRARLAEMAFSHDLDLVEDSMREVRDNVLEKDSQRQEMGIRIEADKLVYAKIRRFQRGASLRRVARLLIDQAYRQAYGLTYTQIVEPFVGCSEQI